MQRKVGYQIFQKLYLLINVKQMRNTTAAFPARSRFTEDDLQSWSEGLMCVKWVKMINVHLLMSFQKFPSGIEAQSCYLEHTRDTAGAKIGPFK